MSEYIFGLLFFHLIAMVYIGRKFSRIADALDYLVKDLDRVAANLMRIELQSPQMMVRVEECHKNLNRIANVMESVHQDVKEEPKDQEG